MVGNAVEEQQKGLECMESLESLEISLKKQKKKRGGERENENFTIFVKKSAAINSKFTTYTKTETERMANEEMQAGAT